MRVLQGTDQIPKEKWISFLSSNPYATPFQSPEFFDFFNARPGLQSANVYALENENQITALCVVTLQKENGLKGYFSRRGIIYGGPLLLPDEAANWNVLLNAIEKDLRRRVIYLEVRNFHDYRSIFPVYEKARWDYQPYLNVQLPLRERSLDDILAGMKYNRRREIRLSEEEGAVYRLAKSEEEVRDLYDILAELYRERVKVPLPGYPYFQQFFLSEPGKVFVVRHQEKTIGGAFCFALRDQGIYTIYYCGLRNYHKKIFPTHLAVLAAVDYGLRNGLKWLDFMGAGLKEKEYGVRNYKMEFGGELVEHGRFLKIINPQLYRLGKLGLAALQKWK